MDRANVTFKKPTQAIRERARARAAENRRHLLARIANEALSACFSYVIHAGGRPTPAQRSFIASYMAERPFFDDSLTGATTSPFTQVSKEALERKVRSYLAACSPSKAERRRYIDALLSLAAVGGALSSEEDEAIREVREAFSLSQQDRATLGRTWGARSGVKSADDGARAKARSRNTRRTESNVRNIQPSKEEWAYEILGCSPSDSDEIIKRSYRQLAVKLHPDKHAARSKAPEDAIPHLRAFQQLQAAYQEIQRLRAKVGARKSCVTAS